jgi:hypothetical protein
VRTVGRNGEDLVFLARKEHGFSTSVAEEHCPRSEITLGYSGAKIGSTQFGAFQNASLLCVRIIQSGTTKNTPSTRHIFFIDRSIPDSAVAFVLPFYCV